jgi:uncharacterized phiE125 gp8 family phage protein
MRVIEGPKAPAVPMELVRDHLRLDADDPELALVGLYAAAAADAVQGYLNRKLISQTVEHVLDRFPCHWLRLPPFRSVEEIAYTDGEGAEQVLASSAYRAVPSRGIIEATNGWPAARAQVGAVRVQVVTGYGDDWNAVPDAIKSAILLMTSHLYENREPVTPGTVNEVPLSYKALLDPYRWITIV